MLNCTATYRSQDKKPDGNKLNSFGFADYTERNDAFEKVDNMTSAFKSAGTSALKENVVRAMPALAEIKNDYNKMLGERLPLCAVTRIETAD